MNPRLQAYLLQCIDHDAVTVDQAVLPSFNPAGIYFLDARSDKAIIDDLRRQLTAVSAELADFRERFYDEVWQTAGCLTLAEGNTDYPPEHLQSQAIKAVIALRQERDRYRTALETINTGMTGDWTPAGIAGQALEGGA